MSEAVKASEEFGSVKEANNEESTASSMCKAESHVNNNSTIPSTVKEQQSMSKTKISEQLINSNLLVVTTRANPSTKLTEISKSNDGSQSEVTVKVERKMPSSRNSGPTKTLNSTSCNDKSVTCSCVCNRNVLPQSNSTVKYTSSLLDTLVVVPQVASQGTQTNETEIRNPPLGDSDAKILIPSKSIIRKIETHDECERDECECNDQYKKEMLDVKRKFAEHLVRQEKVLGNLSEFLEKAFVIRKQHRMTANDLEAEKRLKASLDKIMNRNIPKTDFITYTQERLKQENELVDLLNTMTNMCRLDDKNS